MGITKTVTINKPDGPSITATIAVEDSPNDREWVEALEAALYDRVHELATIED